MEPSRILFFGLAALTICATPLKALADTAATNPPTKVTIHQLLQNKDRWNSNRVEVTGYYIFWFEHSVLTATKLDSSREGIWIDRFRIHPNAKDKIKNVTNGPVRVIGTFTYSKDGAGHANQCPAEITRLELLEEIKQAPRN